MKIALGYVMYKRRLNSYQMSFANVRFVEIMIIILFSNECLASVASGSLLLFFLNVENVLNVAAYSHD